MPRVRVSATVDAQRLDTARRLAGATGSALMDRALEALVEQLEAANEADALAHHPYESDPEVAWESPTGPDLAYEGTVPAEVLALAAERRRARRPS